VRISGGRLFRNQGAALQTNPVDAYPEIEALKAQAESMQRTLDALNNRISEMENN
jgi:prefoldin subunit 5